VTPDVSGGHLSDYTSEAYCRACFLEAFALAVSGMEPGDAFPGKDVWTGFFHATLDLSQLLKAINERAQGT
jgi:hypothetical protein